MVFLIPNTQNRDTEAMQVNVDESIRVTHVHNALLGLDELDEIMPDEVRERYRALARQARAGSADTNCPEA